MPTGSSSVSRSPTGLPPPPVQQANNASNASGASRPGQPLSATESSRGARPGSSPTRTPGDQAQIEHINALTTAIINSPALASAIVHSPALATAIRRTQNPSDRYPTQPCAPEDIAYIALRDLRIGNEPDANLVSLPDARIRRMPDIRPRSHAPTDALHGREFFTALGDDAALPDLLRALCKGHKLARNAHLTPQAIENHERRLRLVASECRRGPSELFDRINQLCDEALTFCGDRTDYFVEQMHAVATLHYLSRHSHGEQESLLYNLGIAYCKLHALREEIAKALDVSGIHSHNPESLEDILNVEFLLQDKLGLPTRHRRPEFGHTARLNAEHAERLAQKVVDRLLAKDGIYVFDFMSQWEPWIQYLQALPRYRAEFEGLHQNFALLMENMPASMNEAQKIDKANFYMDRYRDWKAQLSGQKTREILMNVRADWLAAQGRYPQQFNEVFQ